MAVVYRFATDKQERRLKRMRIPESPDETLVDDDGNETSYSEEDLEFLHRGEQAKLTLEAERDGEKVKRIWTERDDGSEVEAPKFA